MGPKIKNILNVDKTQGVKEEPIVTILIKIPWQISLTSRAHAVCLSVKSVLPKLAWDTIV